MEAAGCLDDETIAAMLEGALSGDRAERARAHITRCDACRRLVSAAIDVVTVEQTAAPGIAMTVDGRSFATTSVPLEGGTAALRAGLPIGTMVAGRYRIERVLGEGGMGVVFAARQLGLERLVALKVLSARLAGDGIALARFQREGRLVASIESDRVVRIHDFGALETGEPFLAMELLEGDDLSKIADRGPSPTADVLGWMRAACDGLGEAHALGIVHRDIKPSNIFLTRGGKVKVLDFGLAKLCAPVGHTAVTGTGIVLGTLGYIAPEQVLGARGVDSRADVFSLGATLYHVITGQPPFIDSSFGLVMRRIASGAMPPMGGLPPDIASVIARCLAREPEARYASARELGDALAMLTAVAPVVSAPPPAILSAPPPPMMPMPVGPPMLPVPVRPKSSPWGTIALVAVLVTVLLGGLGIVGAGLLLYRMDAPGGPNSSRAGEGRFDEAGLRLRLEKLGWKITRTKVDEFPGCKHTDFLIDKGGIKNANVLLLECDSKGIASSEKARLERGFPNSLLEVIGDQVLMVSLPTLAESKALSTQLHVP